MPSNHSSRFLELDLWRGIAVIAMIVFHFVFDLSFFLGAPVDVYTGFWFWFARAIAGSFILLAGISIPLALSRKRPRSEHTYLIHRGLLLLGVGFLITIVTYFLFPAYTIWFGILHALGTFTLLSIFFRNHFQLSLITGLMIGISGILLTLNVLTAPPIIGLFPVIFSTFDYFPLFPWFGIFLIGLGISQWLYPAGNPRFPIRISLNPLTHFLLYCGRQSLGIYLIHQPILIGLIILTRGSLF